MLRHPVVAVSEAGEHNDGNRARDAGAEQEPTDGPNEQHEPGEIRPRAQEEQQHEHKADQCSDEGQRVEELRDDHEGGQEEASDLIVASGERIVDPSAADEEAPLEVILHVGQGTEAVHPQTQAVQLGAGDALVAHQPARRREGDDDRHETDEEDTDSAGPSQTSFLHVLQIGHPFSHSAKVNGNY